MYSDELKEYIDYVLRNCPKITMKEEAVLLERVWKGDQDAKDRLVAAYMRRVLGNLRSLRIPLSMDTVQEANLVMLEFLDSRAGKEGCSIISLHSGLYMTIQRKVEKKERDMHCIFCLRKGTLQGCHSSIHSVDEHTVVEYEEMTGENDRTPWDYGYKTPEEEVFHVFLRETMEKVLTGLRKNESDILKMSFGLDGYVPLTRQEIAERLDMPDTQVRSVEERALRRMRHPSRARLLRDYFQE